ncbi:transcriptional regulator GcvA [Thalassospiraceae bacterium LMO-SO8]|nr:transcriptional regulator GcvA [Alphaproteobacteria bacterium LMO-S08]WND77768.1 transcriptional regulator GcvA [Thalassospiraceae bacterium LMO-SO8]
MSRRLPPLNALRVFEAAARHLSFTQAAEELNVTQAAVSHQIRGLEDWLGFPLFRRLSRALVLTEAGQLLFPEVREAMDILTTAVNRVQRQDSEGVLTVTTMDSFAQSWLVPRLGRFRQAHPDIDVRLVMVDRMVDLAREGVDVAVRYGRGNWPGLTVSLLRTEELFPVCAPELIAKGPPLKEPRDLAHYTLLHDEMPVDWRDWLAAVGCDTVNPERGPGYSHSNLVLLAARAGEGVALGRSVMVADDLAEGRLVRPFDFALPAPQAYYLACVEGEEDRPKIRAFREWLMGEFEAA